MPTNPVRFDITFENTSALTTAYGTAAGTGWVTIPMNVGPTDTLQTELTVTKGTATELKLKMQVSDSVRVAADADNFSDMWKVDSTGAATVEEIQIDLTSFSTTETLVLRWGTAAMSQIRFVAKVDTGTTSTLTVRAAVEHTINTNVDYKLQD